MNTDLSIEMKAEMMAELTRLDRAIFTMNRSCSQATENIVILQNTLKRHILSISNIQDRITQNTQLYIEYCLASKEFAEKYMALANAESSANEVDIAEEANAGAAAQQTSASEAGIIAEASVQLAEASAANQAALDDNYIQARNMSAAAHNSKPLITDDKCLLKTCKNNIVDTTQQINDAIIYEKNIRIKYMNLLAERGCLVQTLYNL